MFGKKKKSKAREFIEAVVIALALALCIRAFIIQAFKIPSGSMEDALLVGDQLMVNKFAYGFQLPVPAMIKVYGATVPFFETRLMNIWGKIERGDVAVFRFPKGLGAVCGREHDGDDFIKRVVATAGETVEIRNAVVYIDGKIWNEGFVVNKGRSPYHEGTSFKFGPYKVPEGMVFFMGDNRDNSCDSRVWGSVPVENISGKALFIYWSWDSNAGSLRFGRLANIIR